MLNKDFIRVLLPCKVFIPAIFFLCTPWVNGHAQIDTMSQQANKKQLPVKHLPVPGDSVFVDDRYIAPDSVEEAVYLYFPEQKSCKAAVLRRFPYPIKYDTVRLVKTGHAQPLVFKTKKPSAKLLSIKGNVLYDVNYRSAIDTPYAEKDVYQHTIQTYLDITWKDNYPFRMFITKRFGNSPLFRNYSDLNLQFNPNEFSNRIKTQLLNTLLNAVKSDTLEAIKKMLEQKGAELNALQKWTENPAQLQKLVEAREMQGLKMPEPLSAASKLPIDKNGNITGLKNIRNYKFSKNELVDSLKEKVNTDSVTGKFKQYEAVYQQNKERLSLLAKELKKLDSICQVLKMLKHANADQLKKEIAEIATVAGLKSKLEKMHLADSILPKGYKTLFALQSLGIGRSIADYSELSAKNISINGFQATYTPRYYYAVAAGIVDYRFRDYIIYNTQQQKQWLALVSIGKGEKEGNHLFLTYYTGRRQLYNSSTNQQANTIPNYSLMGFTIETRININRSSFLTAEIAKSSLPYYSLDSNKSRSLIANTVKLNDRSNEAYSIKLNSFIPYTQTTVTGMYRHTGANFQSFSLFTTGAAQTAWSVKIDQPFFKRRLTVTAGIRENDFTNVFTNTAYQSNAVLKSLQATLRIKKWPVISLGYFPSSQLTKLSDTRFSENLFYTLVGSASHFYKIRQVQSSSTLVYTRFYNESTDSGFVYFNTKNLLYSQSVFLRNITLQGNFSSAINTSYRLYTIEGNTSIRVNKWLNLGGGLKYNKQTTINEQQWGYSGNAKIKIPVLGEIQLMFDKGFLPGINRQLVENNMGRLTYFKIF